MGQLGLNFPGAQAQSPSHIEITQGPPAPETQPSSRVPPGGIEVDVPPPDISVPKFEATNLSVQTEEVTLTSGLMLNLNDCVQMALLNNKEVRARGFDEEAAEWKVKESHPKMVPTFEYDFLSAPAPRDVDNAVESFFTGNLTYLQRGKILFGSPLTTFGKIQLAQVLAGHGLDAEKQKTIQKKNEIILRINKLYFGMLLAKDLRKLLRDAVRHLESEINRRGEGEESENPRNPVDLVRLKLYRFEILTRLSQLEKKDYIAKHAMRIQMGLPRGTDFKLVEGHLRPVDFNLRDFDHYLKSSQKFRPKNRLVDIGLKAKEAEYRLEKRKVAPDIGFGGFFEFGVTTNTIQGLQLTDDFNDPFNFSRAGVGLRIKGKWNPKRHRDKVRQKRAEYFKVAMEKRAADEGLELDIRDAYVDVQQNGKNLENARQAMKTARQYVFLTKTNVDIGVGNKKDHADSLQAYLLSRGRYLEAVFNYNVAVATLQQKAGGVGRVYEETE